MVAPKAELLAELVGQKSPAAVLLANTAEGREVGGRLAVKTGSGILTDVVGLDDDMNAEQVIFGGAINVKFPGPVGHADHRRAAERDQPRGGSRRAP